MNPRTRRATATPLALLALAAALGAPGAASAHPLGNFTVNQFARLLVASDRVAVRYVVDMAEIPTIQEAAAVDADGDGASSEGELAAYASRMAPGYAAALSLSVDGRREELRVVSSRAELQPGVGGLPTLRVETELVALVASGTDARRIRLENGNYADRLGWRELVVASAAPVVLFDSTAYGAGLSDELRAYPEELLMAPLDERVAELSFAAGVAPAGAAPLRSRDGTPAPHERDRLAELIAVPEITPLAALLGLLIAAALGGIHALSPGHGKAVVGAYLVGSRGTPRHAAFLGLTVTITHTAGVFALGLVTLFASQYVVPERLFPVLSLASGAIVLAIGVSLFVKRLRAALGVPVELAHRHDAGHGHDHGGHDHGAHTHSHLPPGADGEPITWRGLLALGVSGGLLPCPSALVVLLAAIALNRVAYGLLLVVAFSAGLAAVLTAVGLAFLYAGRRFGASRRLQPLVRLLPVGSSIVIACIGAAICVEALGPAGGGWAGLLAPLREGAAEPTFRGLSAAGILGLGLLYGLKHATEADHVVAVSTIVSEHKSLGRAALVGGLWGAGHTASLVLVGAVVLALRIAIPESVAAWLELGVALMIVGLGASAVVRGLRTRADLHVHRHSHGGVAHAHIHFHEAPVEHEGDAPRHAHAAPSSVGLKPLVVGAVHGLAGSAALTLLVLTEIPSAALGLLYLAVFGVGSVGGMLIMSGVVGIPFAVGSRAMARAHSALQIAAGAFSVLFGLWYAYETGALDSLLPVRLP